MRAVELDGEESPDDVQVLIHSLCVREGISPEQARELVANDVEEMISAIQSAGEYVIDSVGTLIYENGQIKLVPLTAQDSIMAPVIAAEPFDMEKPKIEPEPEKRSNIIAVRAAASTAAAIVGFGIVALLTMFFNRMLSPESTNMATMGNVPSAREIIVQEHAAVSSPLVLIVNTPSDGAQLVEPRRNYTISQEDNYFLIVASLSTAAEADSYCSTHSTAQIPLTVLNVDGRFRIAAASGESYQAVDSVARNNDIFSSYPSAWICRR